NAPFGACGAIVMPWSISTASAACAAPPTAPAWSRRSKRRGWRIAACSAMSASTVNFICSNRAAACGGERVRKWRDARPATVHIAESARFEKDRVLPYRRLVLRRWPGAAGERVEKYRFGWRERRQKSRGKAEKCQKNTRRKAK